MNKETLHQHYTAAGLTTYAEKIGKYLRHAITITTECRDDIALGASKFGGTPDLPPDWSWPTRKDRKSGQERSLDFVAQINFAESKTYDVEGELPAHGILYLFYDLDAQPWGFDPAERDGYHVAYYDGDTAQLQPRPAPQNSNHDYALGAARLHYGGRLESPNPYGFLITTAGLDEEEDETYTDAYNALQDEYALSHKLLGHSENIQGDMELECQLVTNGLYCGDPSGYQDPRAAALIAGAADWVLLLQIDSDEDNCGMMWGDSGRIYLWIRREDLQARRFAQAHLILQCY